MPEALSSVLTIAKVKNQLNVNSKNPNYSLWRVSMHKFYVFNYCYCASVNKQLYPIHGAMGHIDEVPGLMFTLLSPW